MPDNLRTEFLRDLGGADRRTYLGEEPMRLTKLAPASRAVARR
jgi:hypothetical protein